MTCSNFKTCRSRFFLLVALILSVVLTVHIVSSFLFYQKHLEEEKSSLLLQVLLEKELLKSVEKIFLKNEKNPNKLLKILEDCFSKSQDSLEFSFLKTEGGKIALLFNQENGKIERNVYLDPFLTSGGIEEKVFKKNFGKVHSFDFHGHEVIAAFSSFNLSGEKFVILLKKPVKEIQILFIKKTAIISFLILVLVCFASLLFFRFLNPVIQKLESSLFDLKKLNEELAFLNKELKKKTKELEEASEAKTTFLNNMNHELRTPLHHIMTLSELGSEEQNNLSEEKKRSFFSKILSSAQRMYYLVEQLLEIVRIEQGKATLNLEKNSILRVVDNVRSIFIVTLEKKNLEFEVSCPKDFDKDLVFDYQLILQVLQNLLSNAIKFSPEGAKILLQLRETFISTKEGEKEAVACSVRDFGPGIPEGDFKKIFERFEQSVIKNNKSFGLGLSICKSFVKLHGGLIFAENHPESGAVLTFVLPRKQGEESDT